MTEPTSEYTVKAPEPEPHGAVIEVLHRHDGEKFPYTGPGSVIVPNFVRIDGVAVFCTEDNPVTVREVTIDGGCNIPFAVTMSLLARAVRVGGTPCDGAALGGPDDMGAAVVEIPDVDDLAPGERLDRRYVLLNGTPLLVEDGITVGELSTSYREGVCAAQVTLTLLCRSFVVDDEPAGFARGGLIASPVGP